MSCTSVCGIRQKGKNVQKVLSNEIKKVALSMFRKNFFGIFHGSISAKIKENQFLINKKDAIFDELNDNDFIALYLKEDYRYNDASIDAGIHQHIYQNISQAKYISYSMPPFVTSYALVYDKIIPKDYFGNKFLEEIKVYDPKKFSDWYDRAEYEIYKYFKKTSKNIIVIRGYGVYTYDRDINQMAKNIAILENSCKLLFRSKLLL